MISRRYTSLSFVCVITVVCCTSCATRGIIRGVVRFEGEIPKPVEIPIIHDPLCVKATGGKPLMSERFVIGADGSVQNAFVWVSGGLVDQTLAAPAEALTITGKGCRFDPHVSACMVGQRVRLVNDDRLLHAFAMFPQRNASLMKGMPVQGMIVETVFDRTELGIPLRCSVHPWMQGYLHVLEHPFFAITAANGAFVIKHVPPGDYELSVWQEFNRFAADEPTVKIRVEAGKTAEVTFTYRPAKADKQ